MPTEVLGLWGAVLLAVLLRKLRCFFPVLTPWFLLSGLFIVVPVNLHTFLHA